MYFLTMTPRFIDHLFFTCIYCVLFVLFSCDQRFNFINKAELSYLLFVFYFHLVKIFVTDIYEQN